jgi:uncharacterized membrane protein
MLNPVPRWAVWTTFALSLAGLAISAYLTYTHFQPAALVCSDTGAINCAYVTTSAESYFLGVPVAMLGLAQYLVMATLCSPWIWRRSERWIHVARFALAGIAMCFVLWLISAEVLILGKYCLWCSGVHLVSFALLIVLTRVSPRQLGWVSAPE